MPLPTRKATASRRWRYLIAWHGAAGRACGGTEPSVATALTHMFGRSIHAEPASAVLIDVADARHSLDSHPPHTKRVCRRTAEGASDYSSDGWRSAHADACDARACPRHTIAAPIRAEFSGVAGVLCAQPACASYLAALAQHCTQMHCAHQCDAACVSQHSMLLRARRPSYPPTMYTYEGTGSQRAVARLWWHDDARRCARLRSNHSRSSRRPGQRHRRPHPPAVCCGRVYLHDDSCRRHMRALGILSGRVWACKRVPPRRGAHDLHCPRRRSPTPNRAPAHHMHSPTRATAPCAFSVCVHARVGLCTLVSGGKKERKMGRVVRGAMCAPRQAQSSCVRLPSAQPKTTARTAETAWCCRSAVHAATEREREARAQRVRRTVPVAMSNLSVAARI